MSVERLTQNLDIVSAVVIRLNQLWTNGLIHRHRPLLRQYHRVLMVKNQTLVGHQDPAQTLRAITMTQAGTETNRSS